MGIIMRSLSSFRCFFRPIFVLFFLYLTGDAFFRWHKFHNYLSFSEFIPALSLTSILWYALAVFTALVATIAGALLLRAFRLIAWKITIKHFQLFTSLFISSAIVSWLVKRNILHLGITIRTVLIESICALLIAVFASWLLRSKAGQWMDIIQTRIAPLAWLYGILVILSFLVVTYSTLRNGSETMPVNNLIRPYSTDESSPNIILVTFDSLSARNMSVYDYDRHTTPFIAEWSKKASLFKQLEAAGSLTVLTTTSLMTGKRSWTDNVWRSHNFDTLKLHKESLPVILKKNGYYTMAFTTERAPYELVESIGIPDGFDFAPPYYEFLDGNSLHGHINVILTRFFEGKIRLYNWVTQGDFILAELLIPANRYRNNSITDHPPEKVFNRFMSYIQNKPQRPFFAWIHLYPPHFPYLPPEPYMGLIIEIKEKA
jgi:hypothetical protein